MSTITNNLSTPVVLVCRGPHVELLPLGYLRLERADLFDQLSLSPARVGAHSLPRFWFSTNWVNRESTTAAVRTTTGAG